MKTILALFSLIASSQAFAAPAVAYNCLGKDAISGNSVVFELMFSDSGPQSGYTNESITIIKSGWETLKQPLVFQMYGATKKNNCTKNADGEIMLNTDINMTPTPQGSFGDYSVNVKSECANAKYDIKAVCLFSE